MGGKVNRRAGILLCGVLLAAMLGACGGDDGGQATSTTLSLESDGSESGNAAGDGDGDGGATSDTDAASAEPEPVELALGKQGWWEGTALTVDSLVATPSSFGGLEVAVTGTFENLTDESLALRQGFIVADGEEIDGFWDIPTVPGKGKAEGTITFAMESEVDVIDAAALDKALAATALVFGGSGDNQTKIPLSKSGKVESVPPKTLTKLGTLTHGELIVEVLDGVLAPSYERGAKGKAALDVRIKVSCVATCRGNGNSVDRAMFSVAGPSGQSVVASDKSDYCCDAIYPGDVSDDPRNILRFLVPMPGTGSYTLTMRSTSIVAEGGAPGTLTFTA